MKEWTPLIVAMACVASASAQDATQALYQGRITSNNVNVRTGPVIGDSYPFGKLQSGDVVEVIEESNGWTRVRTSGGAFAGMHAFVSGGTLSADGTTLSLTAETPLRAPNASAQGAARNSYQSIATLPAGTTLNVVETLEVDGLPVYKVRMPGTATGWVNANYVRKAAPVEVQAAADAVKSAPAPAVATTQTPALVTTAPELDASGPAAAAPTEEVVVVEEVVVAEPPKPTALDLFRERRAKLADLESTWKRVREQPDRSEELEAIRGQYMTFLDNAGSDAGAKSTVNWRLQQIDLLMKIQQENANVAATINALDANADALAVIAKAVESRADFDAFGYLNQSVVYDGSSLPELYVLADPTTGQAIAYVVPDDCFEYDPMLGTLVGVKGDTTYDPTLRVKLIRPRTMESLPVSRTPTTPATDAPVTTGSSE
ncbi:MAG: SH3 domain-containing protein [Planctomycetes bacterium]|nr:SH3 domain-containing protein [Planctomycetota bacterium]